MDLVSLLVTIILLALIFGVVFWIVGMLPLAEPMKQIASVAIALLFLLVLLGAIFGGLPMFRLR